MSKNAPGDSAIDVLPPNNPEAEEAVLGSILMDPAAIDKIAFLKAEDFYRDRNRNIYLGALKVIEAKMELDLLTVSDALKKLGSYQEIGGLATLSHLVGVVPTALHVEYYAQIVADCARRRRIISSAGRIAAMAYDGTRSLDNTVGESIELIQQVGHTTGRFQIYDEQHMVATMYQAVDDAVNDDPNSRPIPSSYRELNKYIGGGFKAGKMAILAGRPGQGKTAMAQDQVRAIAHVATKDSPSRRVLWITPEMDESDLGSREASARAKADFEDFALRARQKVWDQWEVECFGSAIAGIGKMPMALVDSPYMTSVDVRMAYLQAQAHYGDVGFIVVDHIGLLLDEKLRDESEPARLGRISKVLRGMAKEFHVPILVLSQLNRNAESRDNGQPELADLRESGHLEQDADLVMLLWRKDHYLRAKGKAVDEAEENVAHLILAKNRQGVGGGVVDLKWQPLLKSFRDLTMVEKTALNNLRQNRRISG